jgi:NAD kinase
MMKPHNSLTYYDQFSYERNGNMREFLQNTFLDTLLESINMQCILVLGGDGTMLRAIGEHAEKELPFLGINFGHKGFLLNDPTWIFPELWNFEERLYPLLEISKNEEKIGNAFNDIHLYSPEGKALGLEISNDAGKVELWGDGVIIATPAGSTGHSKSYGGPVIPHKSEALVITPKGNISSASSKVIDDSFPLSIKNRSKISSRSQYRWSTEKYLCFQWGYRNRNQKITKARATAYRALAPTRLG